MVASISGWDKRRDSSRFASSTPDVIEHAPRLPTHDEIQLRAFEIYDRKGRQEGHSEEDWLEAERELMVECRLEEEDQGLLGAGIRTPASEL